MSKLDTDIKNAIVAHYLSQSGSGNYPVFSGRPVQYGNGLGDIFRSIGRVLLPIFASTARSFISSAAEGLGQGQTLGEAAKSALAPTVSTAFSGVTDAAMRKIRGGGKRTRRRRPTAKATQRGLRKRQGQTGGRRVYKRRKPARAKPKKRTPRKRTAAKHFNSINF